MGEADREPRHGESPRFRVWDAGSSRFDLARYGGTVRRWDGATGWVRQDYTPCSEVDGDVAIAWRDDTLIVEADWLVTDDDDADGDGDRSERVVRRTRLDARPDACR